MAEEHHPEAKKHKKRTKLLVNQLKQQVEFYFSDSNLQKDRFLKKEISKTADGYVNVETIASFNKMKQMTVDIKLVKKAMRGSEILELNSDETMVRRTTPIPENKNVDAETVYVEKLPSHADHEWLRKVFSQFGKVQYVSLPRFRHNGEIKGFALIEFETAKEAEDAVQMFNKDAKTKKEEKAELSGDEQTKLRKRRRSHSESELTDTKCDSLKSDRKRQRTISESSVDSSTENSANLRDNNAKNIATIPEESESERDEASSASEDHKGRKRKKNVRWEEESKNENGTCETPQTRDAPEHENEDETISKKRKSSESDRDAGSGEEGSSERKKKKKRRKKKAKEKKATARVPQMRVISKLEWLKLKEEYKKLQRESMQALKKQLQEHSDKKAGQSDKLSSHEKTKPSVNKPIETKDGGSQQKKQPPNELPFTPGVVLRFQRLNSELSTKDARKQLSAQGPVAYVEMSEDTGEGFVRFHTQEKCLAVFDTITSDSESSLKLSKLTDEEESNYWKKINADRVARFQAKREKKRGTEKVARKADAVQASQLSQQIHIRFDDDE